jgi:hypothetical protein
MQKSNKSPDQLFLIQETVGIFGHDVSVNTVGDTTYIEGIFIKSDVPNGNNRVYPRQYLQTAMENYNREFVLKNKSIGELDHPIPQRSMPLLSEAALIVESLTMDDYGIVYGRARVLKHTRKGKALQALIDDKISMGTSFRALTTLKQGANGVMYAGETIILKAFDVVLIPSVGEDVTAVKEDIDNFENVWCIDGKCEVTYPANSFIQESDDKNIYELTNGKLKAVGVNLKSFKEALQFSKNISQVQESKNDSDEQFVEDIVDFLLLKKKPNGRYVTLQGDKNNIGLVATISRLVDEHDNNADLGEEILTWFKISKTKDGESYNTGYGKQSLLEIGESIRKINDKHQ